MVVRQACAVDSTKHRRVFFAHTGAARGSLSKRCGRLRSSVLSKSSPHPTPLHAGPNVSNGDSKNMNARFLFRSTGTFSQCRATSTISYDIRACIHSFIHTCIHTYIHSFIHTYIHSYIHTYMHTAPSPSEEPRVSAPCGSCSRRSRPKGCL